MKHDANPGDLHVPGNDGGVIAVHSSVNSIYPMYNCIDMILIHLLSLSVREKVLVSVCRGTPFDIFIGAAERRPIVDE